MQMNEQVLTALEVLRNFAENDFECHRIDVLEKDLTAPPVAEVIDEKHITFNGTIYHKHKDDHFTYHSLIHRDIWQYYNGEIPKGYFIHHRNKNKVDNDISNLQLVTSSQHKRLHNLSAKRKKYICEYCGKDFLSSCFTPPRFYSSKCNSTWHKENEREIRICPFCHKGFSVYRHSRKVYCSRYCANQVTSKNNIKPTVKRKCAVCGKDFIVPKSHKKQVCCSQTCGSKFAYRQRRL